MANTLGQSVNLNLASWLSLIGLKRTLSLKALRPITVWSWGQQTIAHYLLLYSKFYWKIAPKIHVLSGPLPEKFADPWCKVSWHIHLHFFFEHIPFRPLAIRLPFFFPSLSMIFWPNLMAFPSSQTIWYLHCHWISLFLDPHILSLEMICFVTPAPSSGWSTHMCHIHTTEGTMIHCMYSVILLSPLDFKFPEGGTMSTTSFTT